jgi:hypothetical protein
VARGKTKPLTAEFAKDIRRERGEEPCDSKFKGPEGHPDDLVDYICVENALLL